MHEKVSLRLMHELYRSADAHADDYERGKAIGAEWASLNILPKGHTAPFTSGCSDTRYNLGVLHGIALELQRLAADLLTPPSKLP